MEFDDELAGRELQLPHAIQARNNVRSSTAAADRISSQFASEKPRQRVNTCVAFGMSSARYLCYQTRSRQAQPLKCQLFDECQANTG
jgi:hypothetical protein